MMTQRELIFKYISLENFHIVCCMLIVNIFRYSLQQKNLENIHPHQFSFELTAGPLKITQHKITQKYLAQ